MRRAIGPIILQGIGLIIGLSWPVIVIGSPLGLFGPWWAKNCVAIAMGVIGIVFLFALLSQKWFWQGVGSALFLIIIVSLCCFLGGPVLGALALMILAFALCSKGESK